MSVYNRRPEWTIVIKRPDYTSESISYKEVPEWSTNAQSKPMSVLFVDSKERESTNAYTDLIGYEYKNSLSDPSGGFSLTLVPREDKNKKTWKDKIDKRDIVFIYEFRKLRYMGFVTGTTYSMAFNNGKPNRSITISGISLGGILESYNLPMNVYLLNTADSLATFANDEFVNTINSSFSEGDDVNSALDLIREKFLSVSFAGQSSGMSPIFNKYFTTDAGELQYKYPIALRPFQIDTNNLWQIYQSMFPKPVYETFGIYENGVYNLKIREVPFDKADWDDLKSNKLDPATLISQSFSDSDDELYTHYFSGMPLSPLGRNEMYGNQYLESVTVFDDEKFPQYGYRSLEATFPFCDATQIDQSSVLEFLKDNSIRLYDWYRNNSDFQSGKLTVHTLPDDDNDLPQVGEKLSYMKGSAGEIQFYIEEITRKMSVPGSMTTSYSLTRGYEYGKNLITKDGYGFYSAQVQKISVTGLRFKQTEQNKFVSGT
ncbi:MAG: hypothetical protein PQJ59_16550 [Spirochaetales bacterium]|nr:hypothetical protein [Spirochaetales bacterium]